MKMGRIITRTWEGLRLAIIVSAVVHLIILICYSLVKNDAGYLNYFHIMSFDLVAPEMMKIWNNDSFSVAIMAILFVAALVVTRKK